MLVSSETKTDSQISDFITAQCLVQSLSGCKTNSQVTVFKFVYQTRRKNISNGNGYRDCMPKRTETKYIGIL